jgi:hypothetical protein
VERVIGDGVSLRRTIANRTLKIRLKHSEGWPAVDGDVRVVVCAGQIAYIIAADNSRAKEGASKQYVAHVHIKSYDQHSSPAQAN